MKAPDVRPEFSPLSIARALWKRKWFIAVFWITGTVSIIGVVFSLQPLYTSYAVIQVESQQIPEAYVAATVQTPLEARLDMLKQQVLSHDRLWGLIESLNLYPKLRASMTKDEVLRIMRDDIGINLVRGWSSRGPGAFEVVYQAPQADIAAEVANRVGMFFINENLRQRTDEAKATSDFLNQQLAEAEKRLRENETILKEFKLTHNGELPQQEAALLASMSQSRTELLGIQEALGRAQQNKLILESSMAYAQAVVRERQEAARRQSESAGAPPAEVTVGAPAAPTAPTAPTELDRALRDLSAARARYYDSHPDVQRLIQEVQRLEREDASRRALERPAVERQAQQVADRRVPQPVAMPVPRVPPETFAAENLRVEELRAQLGAVTQDMQHLESRRRRVLDEIGDVQNRIRALPVREQQLAAITRDYETCRTNYASLLNKKLAAEMAANMERWQKSQRFVMLDQARIPQKPSRPRRLLLSAAGTFFSLLAGALAAFLLQLKANQLLGEWELPANTPILGRIPRLQDV